MSYLSYCEAFIALFQDITIYWKKVSAASAPSTESPALEKNVRTLYSIILCLVASVIKKEIVKALDSSSPVSILLCGPPGCGKSEFLKQIRNHFEQESLFIDGSYGTKAGIFQILYNKRPKYVLLDEIDKLSSPDQLALLNLMENGKLTKTTKSESYEIDLEAWVFATANNEQKILEPLLDRFEAYYLTEYTDDQFRAIAAKRLKQEGIENEELALFIANAVLRGLGRKSFRDAIRIARKSKTIQDVEETIQTLRKYDRK